MPFELPIHRLNQPQTTTWLLSRELRSVMVQPLLERYHSGCLIASATNRIFCTLDPRGNVHFHPKPWHVVEMHAIANRPGVVDCPCAEYFYPECAGPWRLMNRADHHPICQFERASGLVFKRFAPIIESRPVPTTVVDKYTGQEVRSENIAPIHAKIPDRPDELDRARKQVNDNVPATNLRPA